MGCDPELTPCCPGYTYYAEIAHTDDAFEQMCLNAMTYDKKYDLNYDCKLREVDRYVDAAFACCAPLKDKLKTSFLSDVISQYSDWTAEDTQLLLPILDQSFSNRAADKYKSSEIYSYDPYSDSSNMIWGGYYHYESDTTIINYKYRYILPTNAYTWCLLNTNPQTYECDLYKAQDFERSLKACCTSDNSSCLESYIKHSGNCAGITEGE